MDKSLNHLPQQIHFAGIGGAGMSGLAAVLHEAGFTITGSDRESNPMLKPLQDSGISIRMQQGVLPETPELVVRTAAMSLDHPELKLARERGIPIIRRAELLAQVCNTPVSVAVAGTHGKTSITAMIATLLKELRPSAGWFIGGQSDHIPSARLGSGHLRVCEADEFDRSFQELRPSHLVLSVVDWDHVDCYPTRQDMEHAFDLLVDSRRGSAPLIQQLGISALAGGTDYLPKAVRDGNLSRITVGEDKTADLRVLPRGGQGNCFDLIPARPWPGTKHRNALSVRIGLPGAHNRLNAATALAWLLLGEWGEQIEPEAAALAIQDFSGLQRRFQLLASSGRRRLYDDYAHHPSEIRAFVSGLREISGGPVTVIHQPHTFTRVQAFAKETGEALGLADRVILWPVFPAREEPIPGVSHASILPFVGDTTCHLAEDAEDLQKLLEGQLAPDETLATVGAGDLYHTHSLLKRILES